MLSQDEQIALFVDAINKNALKMRREIEKNTKKLYSDETQKLEKAAEAQMTDKLAYAENEIMTELNRKAARDKAAFRRNFCIRREELTNGVFEKAASLLKEFTESDSYEAFLEKSLLDVRNYLEEFILYVREADIPVMKSVCDKNGLACHIEADDKIIIGGLRAKSVSGAKIIDDTLDERLREQREWFLSHAGSELNI